MVKKKSRLWLNKPKHGGKSQKSHQYKICPKPPPARVNHSSSPASSKKHSCTPQKSVTPKRIRTRSPMKHLPASFLANDNTTSSIPEDDDITIVNDFKTAIQNLKKVNLATEFLSFIQMVKENTFPLDNISLLLFLETVRFMSNRITSEMSYRETTKRFWKTGYRLFHGKFLYFMGGPKSIGQITENLSERGMADPQDARINFAVPSQKIISDFIAMDLDIPKTTSPGILYPVLKMLHNQQNHEFMLCADGKKVTAGVDRKGGDVDMFGFEDGITFKERKTLLEDQINILDEIIIFLQGQQLLGTNKDSVLSLCRRVQEALNVMSLRLKDCKELAVRQKLGLQKFKGMAGENWRESRFVFVISGLQASLFQLTERIENGLSCINSVLFSSSGIFGSQSHYINEITMDISYQGNHFSLREHDESVEALEPRYLKQRSDVWHILRKSARITGSTLHSALGLRGLKEQRLHYAKFIEGIDSEVSEDTQTRMKYGSDHEKDGIATLVGKVLPVYFPDCFFIEEGCYIIPGDNIDVLGIVSPDGSIRSQVPNKSDSDGGIIAAVEIKCPFPNDKRVAVHYSLPEYYVCQLLAEMFVLRTQTLIYVSYTHESSTFLKVKFDNDLWTEIWSEATNIYGNNKPKKSTRISVKTKEIKEKIKQFAKNNVEFLCEVQSCTMTDSGLMTFSVDSYYMQPLKRCHLQNPAATLPFEDLNNAIEKCKVFVNYAYEICRRRATEVMVWVLTNKNRNSNQEIPCSIPIAFGLKDYRLSGNAMRQATNFVLKQCTDSGLNILNLSTDGQWIQLMNRDTSGKALTIFQLQKDVWNSTKSMSKQELLKQLVNIFDSYQDRGICVNRLSSGALSVSSKDKVLMNIRGPAGQTIMNKEQIGDCVEENGDDTTGSRSTDWLPDSVINILPENSDSDLLRDVDKVSNEITDVCLADNANEANTTDAESEHAKQTDFEHTIEVQSDNLNDIIDTSGESETTRIDNEQQRSTATHIELTEEILNKLVTSLKQNPKTASKWTNGTPEQLRTKLTSYLAIRSLRHPDLEVLHETCKNEIPSLSLEFRKNWKKKMTKYVTYAQCSGLKYLRLFQPNHPKVGLAQN